MAYVIHCWGNRACFTDPAFKVDRMSYPVITPSAARGIVEAVYWHPGITWKIEKIWVRKPIQWQNVSRNELKGILNGNMSANAFCSNGTFESCSRADQHTPRPSRILMNPEYYIQASVDVNETECSHTEHDVNVMITKRFLHGKNYHNPYFGCREFPVSYELVDSIPSCPEELKGIQDLGWMLWGFDYSKTGERPRPVFYHPVMEDGRIAVPKRSELR